MSAALRPESTWTPPPEDWDLPGMDAVFLVGEAQGLSVPAWFPPEAMEAHLAHCLLRHPADLTTHTRRILFWMGQPDPAGLRDALADLAQVLDGKGTGLMQHLLQKARPFLAADDDVPQAGERIESRYALFADVDAARSVVDANLSA